METSLHKIMKNHGIFKKYIFFKKLFFTGLVCFKLKIIKCYYHCSANVLSKFGSVIFFLKELSGKTSPSNSKHAQWLDGSKKKLKVQVKNKRRNYGLKC